MDGSRFDTLARDLSTTTSRRGTIKAMAAAGLGLGLARLGLDAADARKKKRCKQLGQTCKPRKRKCCSGLLCETREGASSRTCCKGLGAECSIPQDCCEGACLPPLVGDGPKKCKVI